MSYTITKRSRDKAAKYGLKLKRSHDPKYKLDAFLNGDYIDKFGLSGAMDFPSYIKSDGMKYAIKRRELYYKRHPKNYPKFSRDWLSKKILWD